ncbi:hypothetical protein HPB50_024215 [Hyalomma asiaticum]|uniref:Uncharacterized protein n=1 Tax=Hyalomma asiaticum TaxID=266040 RepID=A0ACB7ST62_HYAAI|nr:hypothetical protein HPB50_024215 [Hyalomma asiaticum]
MTGQTSEPRIYMRIRGRVRVQTLPIAPDRQTGRRKTSAMNAPGRRRQARRPRHKVSKGQGYGTRTRRYSRAARKPASRLAGPAVAGRPEAPHPPNPFRPSAADASQPCVRSGQATRSCVRACDIHPPTTQCTRQATIVSSPHHRGGSLALHPVGRRRSSSCRSEIIFARGDSRDRRTAGAFRKAADCI